MVKHPETMSDKFLYTSNILHISQYDPVSQLDTFRRGSVVSQLLEKLNEYRAIVCKLGNRAPSRQDMTENRD